MPDKSQDDLMAEKIIAEQKRQADMAKQDRLKESLRKKVAAPTTGSRPTKAKLESGAEEIAKEEQVEEPVRTYTVQAGDTLGKIANTFYGEAGRWKEIFEANKDKIANPDAIQIGQELVIP